MKQTEANRVKFDYPAALNLYTEFCKENNLEVNLPYAEPATEDEMNTNAFVMVKNIKLIGNKGVVPNSINANEWKYYPWFKINNSGSGLSYDDYDRWYTYSNVPARLCSLDSDNVESDANKFQPIYDILQS
ncbi:MAG TPA: hypothetical protein PKE39_04420 [Ignavibacteria bacterium]|nr:hypothetical protein [Ignavibacteria bacterium]HMQ98247.1 hypothetical protein [Ignavibacteria bacterium]